MKKILIVLTLIFVPPLGIVLMYLFKHPSEKRKLKKLTIIAVIWSIIWIASICSAVSQSGNSGTTESAKKSTATSKKESSKKSNKTDLEKYFDKMAKENELKNVKYNLKNGKLTISYYFSGASEDAFITKANMSGYILFCKTAYKDKNIKDVKIIVKRMFQNSKGKQFKDTAYIFEMKRKKFLEYNWDNLKYQPIYESTYKDWFILYIAPGILSEIKYSDLYYDPASFY